MRRYELTEFEWPTIAPLLPNKPCGVPRVDDRRALNGIFWVLRSGSPWRDLPERHSPFGRQCRLAPPQHRGRRRRAKSKVTRRWRACFPH